MSKSDKDYQRSACYRWEDRVIAPKGGAMIPLEQAQSVVDMIWSNAGLSYPPRIQGMATKGGKTLASANRLVINMQDEIQTWVLLHEIAHSMTSTIEHTSAGHRALWLGLYIKLASQYLGIPLITLTATAARAGLDFDLTATPVFVD